MLRSRLARLGARRLASAAGAAGPRCAESARRTWRTWLRPAAPAPSRAPEAAVSDSARGAPAAPGPLWVTPLPSPGWPRSPRVPGCSYPGNGERLLEVLAPHEAEAPRSRALERYLLRGHGAATAVGNSRGQTGQDAERRAGLPGSCRRKRARRGSGEPGAGGSWAGGGRGRLRPGRVAAACPACPPARGRSCPPALGARTGPGRESGRESLGSARGSRDLSSPAPAPSATSLPRQPPPGGTPSPAAGAR